MFSELQAHKWYTQALESGLGDSANNLGTMSTDFMMSLLYHKLGAYLGNVRAMENVAYTYLSFGKKLNSKEWYTYAIQNGSLSLPLEKTKFEMEHPLKGFLPKAFEATLKQELENSPLAETLAKATKLSYMPSNIKLPKVNKIVIDPSIKGAEILRHRQSFTVSSLNLFASF
jgi:TPR repeat protein